MRRHAKVSRHTRCAVLAAAVFAAFAQMGCKCDGPVFLTVDSLIVGPGIPLANGSGGIGWDGKTPVDRKWFDQAAEPMESTDAHALAKSFAEALPAPSPFGSATMVESTEVGPLAFDACTPDAASPFECAIVAPPEFTFEPDDDEGSLALSLSDYGTEQQNPYATIIVDAGVLDTSGSLVNLGPLTDGAVLFVELRRGAFGCL